MPNINKIITFICLPFLLLFLPACTVHEHSCVTVVQIIKYELKSRMYRAKAMVESETRRMRAAKGENMDAVRLLLAAKADVNARDKDGKTALDVARTDEIKELLKAAGAK